LDVKAGNFWSTTKCRDNPICLKFEEHCCFIGAISYKILISDKHALEHALDIGFRGETVPALCFMAKTADSLICLE
jgi:hypothetical protein